MNMNLWYAQSVDKLLWSKKANFENQKSRKTLSKADRIAHCLFFAVNQGGEFWNVIRKATDQVIEDYDIPGDARAFLQSMVDREDRTIADYLAPFMLNQPDETDNDITILIRKGLIYDLLVKMDKGGFDPGHEKNQKVSLEPLILAMCSQTSPSSTANSSLNVVENEAVDISYSSHLKQRENVQKMLQEHNENRSKNIEAMATPKLPNRVVSATDMETPVIKRVAEDPDTPLIYKIESHDQHETPEKSFEKTNDTKLVGTPNITFNGNVSSLSDISDKLADGSSSPGKLFKSFNKTGALDSSGIGNEFANLKLEDELEKATIERDTDMGDQITEENTSEIIQKETVSAINRESIGNSTFDVSPKKLNEDVLFESTKTSHDQTALDSKEFSWSSINIEKIGHFKDSTPLRCAAFNPTRSEIAIGSNGSALRVFQYSNLPQQQLDPIITINKIHEASIYSCDYSYNGEYFATGSNDKVIKIMRSEYSAESGDTQNLVVLSEMKNHDATIRKVKFLPNSTLLASGGGGDGRIYMTDSVSSQVVKYLDPGHLDGKSNVITDIAIANSNVLYSALNSCVYHWDIRSKTQNRIQIGNNIQTVCCPRGEESNFIASGAEDGSSSFWDVRSPSLPIYTYNKHRKPVRSISLVNDWLLCGSMDGLLSLHNLQQGIPTVELEQTEKLINVQLSSDLAHLATTSSDGSFSFYKINF